MSVNSKIVQTKYTQSLQMISPSIPSTIVQLCFRQLLVLFTFQPTMTVINLLLY